MRVLVTGSEGFIGGNLAEELEDTGTEVVRCDPKIGSSLFNAMIPYAGKIDAIYHLACVNQMDAVLKTDSNVKVNALGAKYMAVLAKNLGIPLIYTSTASVYGNATRFPTPVWHPANPQSDYAAAKLCGEHFIRNSGCDYRIFRLSNVYGPGQTIDNPYCGVVAKFFDSAMKGEPFQVIGDGKQTRDFTFVDDVVNALLDDSVPLNSTLNLSYGRETDILTLAALIKSQFVKPASSGSVAGRPAEIQFIPERSVDGISRRQLLPDYACETTLSEGLKLTYNWYRDVGRDS